MAEPTQKQIDFAESLFNDCGFNHRQKQDYLELRYGCKALDQLTRKDISLVIDDLKDRKRAAEHEGDEGDYEWLS